MFKTNEARLTRRAAKQRFLRWIWLPLVLLAVALRSGAQPAGLLIEKDIVYGEAGGHQLKLDVYRKAPTDADVNLQNRLPAVIAVHGGAWRGGSKQEFAALCQGLANYGYVAFSVDYRLVTPTNNKYPAQIDDVQRAVRWVRSNAKQYNIDPDRVGAIGASAGGHLVALLGTTETHDNSDPALATYSSRVNCVVDLFGPTDFTVMQGEVPATGDANGTANMVAVAISLVRDFLGKTIAEAPEVYREASPITHIDKKTVPFLIFHGTADPLVPLDQSQRFYDALRKADIEAQFIKFEGEGHGFKKPESIQQLIENTRAFLDKHLKPAG